jgi:hypothetical protein
MVHWVGRRERVGVGVRGRRRGGYGQKVGANMGFRWAEVRGWRYDPPLALLALGKVVDVLLPPRRPKNGRVHARDVAVQIFVI